LACVYATHDGPGNGVEIYNHHDDGRAGYFSNTSADNIMPTVMTRNFGVGPAIEGRSEGLVTALFESDYASSNNHVIEGIYSATSSDGVGVYGESTPVDYYGIGGRFVGGYHGCSGNVYPDGSNFYYGVRGYVSGGTGTNYGVYGYASGSGTNYAGYFSGNVNVTGNLSKGGGSFKIDHPLDPENKYLYHSFVESPDMMNVYNGNVELDRAGEAWITMPEWFDTLNRDFRYQLTAIGAPGPNLYVAEEMQDNQFKIAGGSAGMKVSWQVTGIRQDRWAEANRIPVEEWKSADERGRYLHPAEFGQPETRGVEYKDEKWSTQRHERVPAVDRPDPYEIRQQQAANQR
jgi:hypothetical protein